MGDIVELFKSLEESKVDAISVLLVDDQQVFRNVARSVLERDGAYEIIGEAADGAQAIEMMSRLKPSKIKLVFFDLGDLDMTKLWENVFLASPPFFLE